MFRRFIIATVAACIGWLGVTPPASADAVEDAKVAIAAGDGETGAKILADHGYATQPAVLADIIYGAGVLAVQADSGDAFSKAVADSFVNGGVSWTTAQEAFFQASTLVAENAPEDDQLVAELGPGGTAILRTEGAYFKVYLPSNPLGGLEVPVAGTTPVAGASRSTIRPSRERDAPRTVPGREPGASATVRPASTTSAARCAGPV